ncbi:small multi-drug export protein [Candidatus Woesearchaeota archaeon]|nr:small multi-drug export protein [Candidatus Woesearchaeota archaeon]
MLKDIIELIVITFLPFLELRASIPYGILKLNMNWVDVFMICVITNILLGILVYFMLDKFIHLVVKIKPVGRLYDRIVQKTQKRIHKYVDKYGEIGIAIFIGIPLPGSGVYSGALGSYLLGLGYRKFIIACIIGVIIAGTAVTLISLFGNGAWMFFIKNM